MKFLKLTNSYGKEFYLATSKIITLEKSVYSYENKTLYHKMYLLDKVDKRV